MHPMFQRVFIMTVLIGITLSATASASETGWSAKIIATGEFKEKIESTPIELRPNRPLHFYGNTVRRRYYRALKNSSPRTVSKSSQAQDNIGS